MEVGVHIAECFGFRQQSLVVFYQLLGANAVFSGQGVALAQALFYLAKALRIQIKFFQVVAQVIGRGFDLQAGGFHCVGNAGQAFILPARIIEPVAYLAEVIVAGAVVAFVQGAKGLLADTNQPFGVGQTLLFLFQLLQFAFLQGERVQFFQLEAQQFFTLVLLAGLVEGVVVGAAGLLPAAPLLTHGAGQIAGIGEIVQ